MPRDNETRPCEYPKCEGTQTYRVDAKRHGSRAGKGTPSGTVWEMSDQPVSDQPAWICDANLDHIDSPA